MKNKKKFPIEEKKIKEMYKFPLWKFREKEATKKIFRPDKRSIVWHIIFFGLCIWGGYKLAILWHSNFPESFPAGPRWLVELAGGEIGAAIGLLFASFFMGGRRGKWE